MDLSKLKAFVTVAEELNFRRSAQKLGMSQPPLTRLIAALEAELSTPLFERTTRQVRLTGAGVVLLREARLLIESAEKLKAEVRAAGKIRRGALVIGFSTTAFLARLPRITKEFQDRFPKVDLDFRHDSSREILRGVRSGEFDVGFLEGFGSKKDLSSQQVQDEVLGVLLPKGHPLSRKKQVELRDLGRETLILHPRSDGEVFHDRVLALFKAVGVKPKVYIKREGEMCPILVATGKGVSMTIESSAQLIPNETAFVPIKDLFLPVSIYWSPSNGNPTLKSLLSFVMEMHVEKSRPAECLNDLMQVDF